MKTVLVVDDEAKITKLVRDYLERAGFGVLIAGDGKTALAVARSERPDCIILDLGLPQMDGLDVTRELRKVSNVPILMLTARSDESDKLIGLELGADDYITKPFSSKVLLARIAAVLKRKQAPLAPLVPAQINCGDLSINLARRQVILAGREIYLTPTEYSLLHELATHPNQVLLHEHLLSKVWGEEYRGDVDYLRSYIHYLRKKLELDPANPCLIISTPGIGYMLSVPDQEILEKRVNGSE